MFASYLLEIGWGWGQRLTLKVNGGRDIKRKVLGGPLPQKFPLKASHANISLCGF